MTEANIILQYKGPSAKAMAKVKDVVSSIKAKATKEAEEEKAVARDNSRAIVPAATAGATK